MTIPMGSYSTARAIMASGDKAEEMMERGRAKARAFLLDLYNTPLSGTLARIPGALTREDYLTTVIQLHQHEQDDPFVIAFVGVLKAAREEARKR